MADISRRRMVISGRIAYDERLKDNGNAESDREKVAAMGQNHALPGCRKARDDAKSGGLKSALNVKSCFKGSLSRKRGQKAYIPRR